MTHSSYISIPIHPATEEEAGWIIDLVSANPEWRNVPISPLLVTGKCTCGCRSILLEQPVKPQKPWLKNHQGLVAEMSMGIEFDGKTDVVSILLHHAMGSLSLLEVVWYNFPEPVPSKWTELTREMRIDG